MPHNGATQYLLPINMLANVWGGGSLTTVGSWLLQL